jgi:hypothetical protein
VVHTRVWCKIQAQEGLSVYGGGGLEEPGRVQDFLPISGPFSIAYPSLRHQPCIRAPKSTIQADMLQLPSSRPADKWLVPSRLGPCSLFAGSTTACPGLGCS